VERLTQPDWCNSPQPHNWSNACMRQPAHQGDHATLKVYRLDECLAWGSGAPVRDAPTNEFPDIWNPSHEKLIGAVQVLLGCSEGMGSSEEVRMAILALPPGRRHAVAVANHVRYGARWNMLPMEGDRHARLPN